MALRLTKRMAKTRGISAGSRVRVIVEPGRIVIDLESDPTLTQVPYIFAGPGLGALPSVRDCQKFCV